jgi:hypothetical protein
VIQDLRAFRVPIDSSVKGYYTGTRLSMVDDLLRRNDFHGWRITEVEQFLGKPIESWSFQSNNQFAYDLRDRLNVLIFEIDDQQRVK